MLYQLKQGPTEDIILEQVRKQKLPVPDAIKNAPKLQLGLEFFYKAFWDLSNDRDEGMGEGGIPWTSINQYAQRHRIDHIEDFERMLGLIKHMDIEYRKFRAKKQKDEIAKNKKS